MGGPQRRVRTHQATSKSRTLNAKIIALLRHLQDEGEVNFVPEGPDMHGDDLADQIVENTIDCLEHERVQVLALGSQVHAEERTKLEAEYRRDMRMSEDERIDARVKFFRGPDNNVYDFPPAADGLALRDGRTVIWKDAAVPTDVRHAKIAIHEINHVLNSTPPRLRYGDDIAAHLNDIASHIVFEMRAYVMQAMCFDKYGGGLQPNTRAFQRHVFEDYMLSSDLYSLVIEPYKNVAALKRRIDTQIDAAWTSWPGNHTNKRT